MTEKDMWLATKRKPCLLMIFLNKLQMSLKTLLKDLKPLKMTGKDQNAKENEKH